jgi:hypothetical protein
MTEAVAQLQKGVDLVADLPDGAARHEQELDQQLLFGRALMAAKGYGAPELGENSRAIKVQFSRRSDGRPGRFRSRRSDLPLTCPLARYRQEGQAGPTLNIAVRAA